MYKGILRDIEPMTAADLERQLPDEYVTLAEWKIMTDDAAAWMRVQYRQRQEWTYRAIGELFAMAVRQQIKQFEEDPEKA